MPDRPVSDDAAASGSPDPTSSLTADAFNSRTWWVYLQLDSPRSVADLAASGGITPATTRAHLNLLKARSLVAPQPGSTATDHMWSRTASVEGALLEQIEAKSARVAKRRPSENEPTGFATAGVAPVRQATPGGGSGPEDDATPPGPSLDASPIRAKTLAPMPHWLIGVAAAVTTLGLIMVSVLFSDRDDVATASTQSVATPSPETTEPNVETRSTVPQDVAPEDDEEPEENEPRPEEESVQDGSENPADQAGDGALLAYISLNSADFPYFISVGDDLLVNLAQSICRDLSDGYDPYSLAFQLVGEGNGPDSDEAAAFVGASIGSYCMQHEDSW